MITFDRVNLKFEFKLYCLFLQGIFMFVDNQEYYGHLVDSEHFETKQLHNDLYEIFDNRYVRSCFIIISSSSSST